MIISKKLKFVLAAIVAGVIVTGTAVSCSKKPAATIELDKPVVENTTATLDIVSKKLPVERLDVDPEQVLVLNTEVNSESVELLIAQLQKVSEDHDTIYLVLDSPGGSVFDGSRLISYMEASPVKINTVVYGLCASMCFQIFERGHTRYMVDRSVIMGHQASGGVRGNIKGMKNLLTFIEKEVKKLDAYIADRAKMSRKDFDDLVTTDLWLAADDAIALNLADKLAVISLPPREESFIISEKLKTRRPKSLIQTNPLKDIY